ncbi:hypothetical protein DB30_07395 [Enhygromyxa salina]|uniref:Outer membrane lipoprotein BamD-like domain-containing protein n=1 Tax=Enhygromyxa salina TaxID=215803 RepID=A0A0C1Z8M8_9BACT|nr:hypothetical protein DB30_07395 [Enhygromyxa salina]
MSEEDDAALISAAVTAHLESVHRDKARQRVAPWLAATGLLAAAAALALWLLPSNTNREVPTVTQVDTGGLTHASWVLEQEGTPLEGVVATTDRQTCGTRDGARACLAPGSRGAFELNGNVELHEGTARVEAEGPIVLSVAGVGVQATTDTADFSATRQAAAWKVVVERGAVTVTRPDGASRVLEAGESTGSEPEVAVPVDTAESADPPAVDPHQDQPASAPSSHEHQHQAPSADALLELARSQRAASDFAAAAKTYEQLIRAYPSSAKVRTTHVSLAQLYQGPLNDPAKALRHFDRYLKRGGPLAEEAHYGKIRALRSLGQTAAAKTELDAFLQTYPNSAHADALRGD